MTEQERLLTETAFGYGLDVLDHARLKPSWEEMPCAPE
jgi:hypothetical protein